MARFLPVILFAIFSSFYLRAAPMPAETTLADELFWPQACKENKPLTGEEWENLRAYGRSSYSVYHGEFQYPSRDNVTDLSGIPFMGTFVVQSRQCAKRSKGDDCSPWKASEFPNNGNSIYPLRLMAHGEGFEVHYQTGVAKQLRPPETRIFRFSKSGEVYGQDSQGLQLDTGVVIREPFSSGNNTEVYLYRVGEPQLNPRCLRVAFANSNMENQTTTHKEMRVALVLLFDPNPVSELCRECEGKPMTVATAEERFPKNAGLDSVSIPTKSASLKTFNRECKLVPGKGPLCGDWHSEKPAWATTFVNRNRTLVFREGKSDPVTQKQLECADVEISTGMAQGNTLRFNVLNAIATGQFTTNAPVSVFEGKVKLTDHCFLIPLYAQWTGSLENGWTENKAIYVAEF
jgi:hypothetical protein